MALTYVQAKEAEIKAFEAAAKDRSGTCNYGVVDDIVDWVVRRDSDASQKFWDAVRGGATCYDSLKARLGHDSNALDVVSRCEVEARQSLANHGCTKS